MADLIDREAMLWEYKTNNKYRANAASLAQCIHDAPTFDAVEVVRCMDCDFYGKNRRCAKSGLYTSGSDYCSYGERKTDG